MNPQESRIVRISSINATEIIASGSSLLAISEAKDARKAQNACQNNSCDPPELLSRLSKTLAPFGFKLAYTGSLVVGTSVVALYAATPGASATALCALLPAVIFLALGVTFDPTGFPINLLGNGLLKDFDMIVDFQKDEIYLKKRV